MADDLKLMTKDVPQASLTTQVTKKKHKADQKKKPEAIDKEVWNITGGLYPMKPQFSNQSNSLTIEQRRQDLQIEPSSKWVYVPINQNNKKLGDIYHWIQEANKDKVYALEKFNIKCDIIQFTDEEYETHLKDLAYDWNLEETRYLWELVYRYDQRWLVIQDAYKYDNRSVEDLKKRYYEVSKKMLHVRDQKSHPIYNYQYDAEYEKIRKLELEKYMIRNKDQNEEEKKIMEELKLIQNLIKKEEKEEQTVKRILQQEAEDPEFQDEDDEGVFKQYQEEMRRKKQMKTKKFFLRGRWIEEPLPLPAKFNKRLKVLMEELNVPSKILPTEKNEQLYDDLRENILKIFTVSKFIQRKDLEKKRLEERLQILKQQEQNKIQQAQQQQAPQNQPGQQTPTGPQVQGTPSGNVLPNPNTQSNIPGQNPQNINQKQIPPGANNQNHGQNVPIQGQHQGQINQPNQIMPNQGQGNQPPHHQPPGQNHGNVPPSNYSSGQSEGMNLNQKRSMPPQYQVDGPQDIRKMQRPNPNNPNQHNMPPGNGNHNSEYNRGGPQQYNNNMKNNQQHHQNYNMNQQGNYNQNAPGGNQHQGNNQVNNQHPMYKQQYRNEGGQYNNSHQMHNNHMGGGGNMQ